MEEINLRSIYSEVDLNKLCDWIWESKEDVKDDWKLNEGCWCRWDINKQTNKHTEGEPAYFEFYRGMAGKVQFLLDWAWDTKVYGSGRQKSLSSRCKFEEIFRSYLKPE